MTREVVRRLIKNRYFRRLQREKNLVNAIPAIITLLTYHRIMPAKTKKGEKEKEESKPTLLNGVYIFPNGDRYEGDYLQSSDGALERTGHGIHTTAEGVCYKGQWVSDKMAGEGVVRFPSGSMYEGEFVNNQFNGKGRYTWPNGAVYEGLFNENKMEGDDGEFTDTDKQVWVGAFRYKAAPGLKFKLAM